MDRSIAPQQHFFSKFWRRGALSIVLVGLVFLVQQWATTSSARTSDGALIWSVVRRGDVEIRSPGSGEFFSTRQRQLNATEIGVVEDVLKSAGDTLVEGDLILRLQSPQLMLDLETAELNVRRAELDLAEVQSRTSRELESASVTEANDRIGLEVAQTELRANAELLSRKIVSKLQYELAEARHRQSANTLASSERLTHLARQQAGLQVSAAEAALSISHLQFSRLQERVNGLQVRAPNSGLLKRVDLRLGDSVGVGSSIALVGPIKPDAARMRFPQRFLSDLQPGVVVELIFNGQKLRANISRVSPDLSEGYVLAEVQAQDIPDSARIDMAVRGEALLGLHRNVLFASSPFEPPPTGQPLRVHVRRNGQLHEFMLKDVQAANGSLIFSSGVLEGDEIALQSAL